MEVILKRDIDGLGEYGEVKIVKDGFARNFLLPKGLAEMATKEAKEKIEQEKAKYLKEKEGKIKEVEKVKTALEKISLEIPVKVGADKKMFGSVTNKDIALEIYKTSKIEIDKKDIEIEPIHEVGDFEAIARLGEGIKANIKIKVKGGKNATGEKN